MRTPLGPRPGRCRGRLARSARGDQGRHRGNGPGRRVPDSPPRGGSGRAPEGMAPEIRAGPPFTPDGGCRRLTGRAGSHDPANGRSGGRGEPSSAPSHPTAPPWVRGYIDVEEPQRPGWRRLERPLWERTTIPPSCRRIGPGDRDYSQPAAVVDAWPNLPGAIPAGILARV